MTHTLAATIATAVLIVIPLTMGVTLKSEPEPIVREIIIGSICDAGDEIVTGRWDDPALDGCKEVRVHTVALTDV